MLTIKLGRKVNISCIKYMNRLNELIKELPHFPQLWPLLAFKLLTIFVHLYICNLGITWYIRDIWVKWKGYMDITITIIHISAPCSVICSQGSRCLGTMCWQMLVWRCLTNYAPCCPAPDLNNILYVTVLTSNNTAHCHHTARGQLGTDKIIYIF